MGKSCDSKVPSIPCTEEVPSANSILARVGRHPCISDWASYGSPEPLSQMTGWASLNIRPNPPAIVMVGRRSQLNAVTDAARHQWAEQNGIEVQTYDRLRGGMSFSGPPGANPHLIRRTSTEEWWDSFRPTARRHRR